MRNDHFSVILGRVGDGIAADFGMLGVLVRRIDAGEILEIAAPRLPVEPFLSRCSATLGGVSTNVS